MYCDTTKTDGQALPIYLTDVIYHMSQHLKELDREENRGVKSVAIISPVICLAEQNGNRFLMNNSCSIYNNCSSRGEKDL